MSESFSVPEFAAAPGPTVDAVLEVGFWSGFTAALDTVWSLESIPDPELVVKDSETVSDSRTGSILAEPHDSEKASHSEAATNVSLVGLDLDKMNCLPSDDRYLGNSLARVVSEDIWRSLQTVSCR